MTDRTRQLGASTTAPVVSGEPTRYRPFNDNYPPVQRARCRAQVCPSWNVGLQCPGPAEFGTFDGSEPEWCSEHRPRPTRVRLATPCP